MKSGIVRVEASNGVSFNFRELSGNLEHDLANAAIDLAIRVRAETPNRDLGHADAFLGAGEWGLAIEEIAGAIASDDHLSEFVVFARKRAFDLIAQASSESPNTEEQP